MTSLLEAKEAALSGRLQPTSLSIGAGELVALIGPNGSGKTSLLRMLADVEGEGGTITIGGEALTDTPPSRRAKLLSFLPASRDVAWPISARDVIALASPSVQENRIDALIDLLDLREFAGRPVNRLSTGERARVLLARALAPEPYLLLLDEPLSNLDPYWALRIIEILRSFVAARDHAALVSVHDLGHIEAFDRVIMMGSGNVIADGESSTVLASPLIPRTFGIERSGHRWKLSPPGDPRSLR